ncbi:MAG TPA: radical SAM protein [Bacteroidales bacterium]|nr:radical SAM protein [Bacteroidales bacterium]HPT02990.1 radical SAM protein [Bacteroidales bacterium]
MFDSYNRNINYLRISVTDRCNLRCVYCMPAGGVVMMKHEDILSFEEILSVVKAAVGLGVNKVRITGGEPLVRKGITELVRIISGVKGIQDLSMTTNGQLLESYALPLKDAGLMRVNISLDAVDPSRYSEITRGGNVGNVFKGIEAAKKAGLSPVKINCVIKKSPSEPDAREVERFCRENGLEIRFIREMDLENGEFYVVQGGSGGDCARCNRLRLTANGMIKPCLFNNLEYNVRTLGVEKALQLALENKPECGTFNTGSEFYNVGG